MKSDKRNARRRNARRIAATTVASGLLAAGALALTTSAASASTLSTQSHATSYTFAIHDNAKDLTFNQLLGINDEGVIAGYFGSGAAGHPNKGVGQDANFGFVEANGQFRTADFPTGNPANPPTDQLLGVNDENVAVGFYTDGAGTNHGYEYNIRSNHFSSVVDPNAPAASLTAAAINDEGDVAGFYTNPAGTTDGFLKTHHGQFIDLAVPGAASTMALGVDGSDEVVGVYTVGSGSTAAMHGFTWTARRGFSTVDDPLGAGTTTINGVNDRGQLVGFYVDSAGNTDGFLATPQH